MAVANYMRLLDCHTQQNRECCMHRSNIVLTMNPPVPVDICCHCGKQVYRYDLQQHDTPKPGHGPYLPHGHA